MHRIVVVENTEYTLNETDFNYIFDIIDMSSQIKSALGLRAQPFQMLQENRIKVVGVIGNITLNNINLIILPKFKENDSVDTLMIKSWIQRLYHRILRCSQNNLSSTIYFSRNQVIDDDQIFIDVIAEYFIAALGDALKKSHIITYEEHIDKLASVRGRILIQKQLSQPIVDANTWCKFKKISRNNVFNQLLGWACNYLYNNVSNISSKKKLYNLAREFPYSIDMLSKKSVENIKLPRNFRIYTDCINLARNLYLGNAKLKEKSIMSGNRINGYVINMEKAFENIVSYYSRIASLDLGVVHRRQRHTILAINEEKLNLNYDVRPDDLIFHENKRLILDAKYKVISDKLDNKKKPNSGDIYQMISSCIAHNTWEAILIYPEHDHNFNQRWEVVQNVNGKNIILKACTINTNVTDRELVSSICSIIENTDFYEGVINDSELSISI